MLMRKPTSREKILAAASDLARECGPGHLSLEAVASRAGVSKGGLLYNFPSKAKLMQGVVAEYLKGFEVALDAAAMPGRSQGATLLGAYMRMTRRECENVDASASGVLAAMIEDPEFLQPIKAFKRRLLDRLREETPDNVPVLMLYLMLEGLRSTRLFDLDVLTDDERRTVNDTLDSLAASAG